MTTQAAKAYQGDHKAMRDFGERAAQATKFFQHPDPDYFDFQSCLKALLEEIFVYDALVPGLPAQVRQGTRPRAARQRPGQPEPGQRARRSGRC